MERRGDERMTSGVESMVKHRIPHPDGVREPLKINVFERMQSANTQLVPLFPYYGPEAFVYCGALFRGRPGYNVGHFFHNNTRQEVSFVWGSNGALINTGRIMATPNLHGVNSFLRDPESPENFLVIAICQRQTDGEEQTEAFIWRCSECHNHLFQYEGTHVPSDDPAVRFPGLPTITESVEPAERFNADESIRTCTKCGHVNDRFPLELWGWAQWDRQQRTVNDARDALLEKAAHASDPDSDQ
jgi:hypothetical protein